jgi:protein-disulfide isomerase
VLTLSNCSSFAGNHASGYRTPGDSMTLAVVVARQKQNTGAMNVTGTPAVTIPGSFLASGLAAGRPLRQT